MAYYIHGLGLKFGVHPMWGIPREAAEGEGPINGSDRSAAEIADVTNVCLWNADMYGVDMSKPGTQEYYNSVFEELATWNLDFVKVDDLSRPHRRSGASSVLR